MSNAAPLSPSSSPMVKRSSSTRGEPSTAPGRASSRSTATAALLSAPRIPLAVLPDPLHGPARSGPTTTVSICAANRIPEGGIGAVRRRHASEQVAGGVRSNREPPTPPTPPATRSEHVALPPCWALDRGTAPRRGRPSRARSTASGARLTRSRRRRAETALCRLILGGEGRIARAQACSSGRLTKSRNSGGCAGVGLARNSGWYCTPTNHGWSGISTTSTSRSSGEVPEQHQAWRLERLAQELFTS